LFVRKILEEETELAHIYDLTDISESSFPTPAHFPMQFGVGVTETGHQFQPHVHKEAKRTIDATAEFVYVLEGKMDVTFLGRTGTKVETVEIMAGMCFLQVAGGHAISSAAGTRYFELKQGPYFGRDFDKYDVEV
jgi:oxalate decarboxylase/phosphoglucose isomerase-like protein (cupin superfamily)